MKKILSLTFGSLLTLCFMLLGITTKTYAAEVPDSPKEDFINVTYAELGLPDELDIQTDLSSFGQNTSVSVNGFDYEITNSYTMTATSNDTAANYETIYITSNIGTWGTGSNSLYNQTDFTKFTNAKNIVFDVAVNTSTMYRIFSQTNVENVFVTCDNDMPLFSSSNKIKNIVFTNGLGWLDGNKWDNYNVDLSGLPNAKIITLDSFKYAYRASIDSYSENQNYNEGEHYPLYVIQDSDFKLTELVENNYSYVEFGGAYYTYYRTNLDMFPKLGLAYIDDRVTKIIIDPNAFEKYGGAFTEYSQKIDTIYLLEGGENSQIKSLKATNLIAPMPSEFVYADYENFENVYFYSTEELDTLLIGEEGITSDQTVNVKFYIESDASFLNQSKNSVISTKITKVDSMPEALVEIEVDTKSVATSDPNTKLSTLLEELNKEDETVNGSDQGTTGGNTEEDDKGNDTTDDTKDENDKTVGDEIKDAIDDFKEDLKENKALQAVTAVASVLLAFVVGYLMYILVRKIIRWVK